jgi:hypothetical protein
MKTVCLLAAGFAGLAAMATDSVTVTDALRRTFREQGYVVMPGVLTDAQLEHGRALVERELAADPPPPGHLGNLARWPRFTDTGPNPLLDFYRDSGVARLAGQLLRADLPLPEPDFAQVAVTIPPWPHRPGGPHLDGLTPMPADGIPGTFSLLAGVWLSDQSAPDHGNLWVWPGTHLRAGAYFAEHGPDAITRVDELGPGPYPAIHLGEPAQAMGPAGSVLFAHYLLAHNIGCHDGPADAAWRRTLYYRLATVGHRRRWRTIVTEPLHEFR